LAKEVKTTLEEFPSLKGSHTMICTPEAIASGVQIIVWPRFLYLCDGGWGEFYSTWKAHQKTPEMTNKPYI